MRPDFRSELSRVLAVLAEGGLILYPTDTIWGIGCDATNELAVAKIYDLKKRPSAKAMICLVADQFMLESHVKMVPDIAYDILDLSEKPTTIIYDHPKGVAGNLIAKDNTLGIRVASDPFCQHLIKRFKKPLVATSANFAGGATPETFSEIEAEILAGVDYVVNLDHDSRKSTPSAIIKLGSDGIVQVIRK
ncbi:MAG TPA: L-threonylcarbamoyladenylate synthase [Eudoraea sp.]|nr:L-threonylcarbamoyladenylate synthase [Eudoraea sp.]